MTSSEQRLHPASILFDTARNARVFAWPALLAFFSSGRATRPGMGRFDYGLPDIDVWLWILVLPSVFLSVARFLYKIPTLGHLGIGLQQSAQIAAEPVLVELLVRLDVPQAAEVGLISSATTIRIMSFSQRRPVSILKSTSRMPTPRNTPDRKSLTRMAIAMMSSISWGVAQPNAVMCSSDTIGSPSYRSCSRTR